MSRAYTKEEVREQFLDHIRTLVNYWDKEGGRDSKDKLEGLAFSFLTLLDGCACLPAFDISPSPHPEDREYYQENGENWYEDNMVINDDTMMHEIFCKK